MQWMIKSRLLWVVPPAEGRMGDIDLSGLNPADEYDRSLLILAEHPELYDAVIGRIQRIEVHGKVIRPQLHISIHEVVANQILDDDPSEMWHTAQRLIALGFERHHIFHMLGSVVAEALTNSLKGSSSQDDYVANLNSLPEFWKRRSWNEPLPDGSLPGAGLDHCPCFPQC